MNQVPRSGRYVVGVDEMGTGAWAGPFFVCAAAVPVDWKPPSKLNDSKKIKTVPQREAVFAELIVDPAILFYLHPVFPAEIDTHGQAPTLRHAMRVAAQTITERLESFELIFDGVYCALPTGRAEPKADGNYPAVMAASVLGKVARDRLMMQHYAKKYPHWGFDDHKGYGTDAHIKAIEASGLSPIHRRSISRFTVE